MKQMKTTILLLAVFTLTALTGTQAAVYSQALNLNNDGGPFSFPGQQIADAFQLSSAASLSTLDWYGDNFANAFPSTVAFTINLYADAGGIPANSPFSSQSVIATAVDTGMSELDCCSAFAEIFLFNATLPSAVALSGNTTYWLSILDASGSQNIFRWANGTTTWAGDINNACCAPGSWTNIGPPRDQAAYDLNPVNVPEPGSLALLGSGVVAVAGLLRRKLMR